LKAEKDVIFFELLLFSSFLVFQSLCVFLFSFGSPFSQVCSYLRVFAYSYLSLAPLIYLPLLFPEPSAWKTPIPLTWFNLLKTRFQVTSPPRESLTSEGQITHAHSSGASPSEWLSEWYFCMIF
jgi:hypothetical protein